LKVKKLSAHREPEVAPKKAVAALPAKPESSIKAGAPKAHHTCSPHELLYQATAILECMRVATLYGDAEDVPPLMLTDACKATTNLVRGALEGLGDDTGDSSEGLA